MKKIINFIIVVTFFTLNSCNLNNEVSVSNIENNDYNSLIMGNEVSKLDNIIRLDGINLEDVTINKLKLDVKIDGGYDAKVNFIDLEILIKDDVIKILEKYEEAFIVECYNQVNDMQLYEYTDGYILGINSNGIVENIDYSNAIELPENAYIIGISRDRTKILIKSIGYYDDTPEVISKYFIYSLAEQKNLYNFFEYKTFLQLYLYKEAEAIKDISISDIIKLNSNDTENIEGSGVVSISPNYEYVLLTNIYDYDQPILDELYAKNLETGEKFEILPSEFYEKSIISTNKNNSVQDNFVWINDYTTILFAIDIEELESRKIRFIKVDFKNNITTEILSIDYNEILKLYKECIIYEKEFDIPLNFYGFDENQILMNVANQRLFKINLLNGNLEEIINPLVELENNYESNCNFLSKSLFSNNGKYFLFRMPTIGQGNVYCELINNYSIDTDEETYVVIDYEEYGANYIDGLYLYDESNRQIIKLYNDGDYDYSSANILFPRQFINFNKKF